MDRRRPLCLSHTHWRCLCDFPTLDARRTYPHATPVPFGCNDLDRLKIWQPATLGLVVRVTDVISGVGSFATHITYSGHVFIFLPRNSSVVGGPRQGRNGHFLGLEERFGKNGKNPIALGNSPAGDP